MLNENLRSFSLQSGLINIQIRAFVSLFSTNFMYFDAFNAFLNVAFQIRGLSSSPVNKKVEEIITIEIFQIDVTMLS